VAEEQKQQKSAAGDLAGQAAGKGVKSLGKNLASNASKAAANAAKAVKMGTQAAKVAATAASAAATAGLALAAAAIQAAVEKLVGKMKKEHIAAAILAPFLAIIGAFLAIPLAILGTVAIAILALIVLVPSISFIINSGAYIVPPYTGGVLQAPGNVESPYIRVIKTAEPRVLTNDQLPYPVQYTIQITAKQGALTNITYNNECSVIWDNNRGTPPGCPSASIPDPPDAIPAGTTFTFTYTMTFTLPPTDYTDTLVVDVFTVSADAPVGTSTNRSTASGTATVRIGNPPDECPGPWPVRQGLRISQGPGPQHYPSESVDVPPAGLQVVATHSGVASVGWEGAGYGNYVRISSICNGVRFWSTYAHLEVVTAQNGVIKLGDPIGISGATGGGARGAHIHYDFGGLRMWEPNIYRPQGISSESAFRGCVDSAGVGLCGYVP